MHLREKIQDTSILLKLGIQDYYVYSSLSIAFRSHRTVSKRVIAIKVLFWLFSKAILLLSNLLKQCVSTNLGSGNQIIKSHVSINGSSDDKGFTFVSC